MQEHFFRHVSFPVVINGSLDNRTCCDHYCISVVEKPDLQFLPIVQLLQMKTTNYQCRPFHRKQIFTKWTVIMIITTSNWGQPTPSFKTARLEPASLQACQSYWKKSRKPYCSLKEKICHVTTPQLSYSSMVEEKKEAFTVLCQRIWERKEWKSSLVLHLPKKGNSKYCQYQRTKSLISHLNKIKLNTWSRIALTLSQDN